MPSPLFFTARVLLLSIFVRTGSLPIGIAVRSNSPGNNSNFSPKKGKKEWSSARNPRSTEGKEDCP